MSRRLEDALAEIERLTEEVNALRRVACAVALIMALLLTACQMPLRSD